MSDRTRSGANSAGGRGLYIHVPFCLTKCPYCDFYSERYTVSLAKEYAAAVIRNLRRYPERFDTVYFGGGTPALLYREIVDILAAVNIVSNAEITVEINPCLCTDEILSELLAAGVNRLSVGVQSFDDRELSALGRRHKSIESERGIKRAYDAGFGNISADIMLAVPLQTQKTLKESIERLLSLPITHISAYMLKIEPSTPVGKNPPALPDEDETAELYLQCCELLKKSGFKQYEISNFAKAGFESRHNLKYWRWEEYLGIGTAAHSFYDRKRFAVPRDIYKFINAETQPTENTDEYSNECDERIMLGLRLSEGISKELWEPLKGALKRIPREYYRTDGGRLSLTPKGFLVSNEIIALLLAEL